MRSDRSPLVLIGAARSGTKYLRDVLATSNDIVATPYDVNYVWRHGNESCPHDEIDASDVPEATSQHIRRQLDRLVRTDAHDNARFLLEKTVSNTLRMDMVRKVLPEARFIYLERDGHDVVESSYRQWTAPNDRSYLLEKLRTFPVREWRYAIWFARNALKRDQEAPIWGPRYEGIESDLSEAGVAVTCALQWKKCVEAARRQISPTDTFVVRYEDLSDEAVLAGLLEWIGVGDPESVAAAHRAQFRLQQTWPGALPSEAVDRCAEIVASIPPLD